MTGGAIFFDALGTLFHLTSPQVIFSHVLKSAGHDVNEDGAERLLRRANRWWIDPDRPTARSAAEELEERREYVRIVLEDYGRGDVDGLADRLLEDAYWARWARPFPDAAPTLEALRPHRRLAVLSNGGPSSLDAVHYADLGGYFEAAYAGLELGFQKPNPRAYELAAEALGVESEEALLVDDTPENVDGATTCGMRGVLLDRADEHPEWSGMRIRTLQELAGLLDEL